MKRTPLEAVLKGNTERKKIASNEFFNTLMFTTKLLERGQLAISERREIMQYLTWHTGTCYVFEAKDKPFGTNVERELHNKNANKRQTLIYRVPLGDIGAFNRMFLFDHGFRNGECLMRLINAKTSNRITTTDDLHGADEIILEVIGGIRSFRLKNRDGGVFKRVGGGETFICALDCADIGFLLRGYDFINDFGLRHRVNAGVDSDLETPRGVVYLFGRKSCSEFRAARTEWANAHDRNPRAAIL